jgi:hypothetical protein|tara:strand:- start:346 stop:711 length:366 start_codon:yes stop_codon:yes gene_type:complete
VRETHIHINLGGKMAYRKDYYIKNKDKFNEKSRKYYEKNKDKILGQIKEARANRTDEERETASSKRREYYLGNRDKFIDYASKKYIKDKAKLVAMKERLAELEKKENKPVGAGEETDITEL